jgi:hypothetical protein
VDNRIVYALETYTETIIPTKALHPRKTNAHAPTAPHDGSDQHQRGKKKTPRANHARTDHNRTYCHGRR